MASNTLKYGYIDDGNIRLEHPKGCCGSSCGPLTKKDVEDIVGDMIVNMGDEIKDGIQSSIKEVNDKLLVNGEVVAEDDYVKGGYYDPHEGYLHLHIGKNKDVKIKMRGMSDKSLDSRYVLYSGYLYPNCNKPFSIILDNDEALFGKCCDGHGIYSLASINKRNIADIGSKKIPLNLQGLTDRPKYNGFDSVALMSDIPDVTEFATIKWVKEKLHDAIFGKYTLDDYLTKEEGEEVYQPKGDYVTTKDVDTKISPITEEEIRSLL